MDAPAATARGDAMTRRASRLVPSIPLAALAALLLTCSQPPPEPTARVADVQVVARDWAFVGGHDLLDFEGADVESPWIPWGEVLGTGYEVKVRYRLTTWARDWSWPVQLQASAAELVAGEAATLALQGIPGSGAFSNGTVAGVHGRVRARLLGETIADSGWQALEQQGLRAAGTGPAPLFGTARYPEDVCLSVGLLPRTDFIPDALDPLSFNVCLIDELEGGPLHVQVAALGDLAPVPTGLAELGATPVELTILPTSGHPRLLVTPDKWVATVVDRVSWKIKTVAGVTLLDIVDAEYQRAEEAFSWEPWPPSSGTGYRGEPPPPAVLEFTARPGVSQVSPANGPMAGGTPVTLTGGAFEGATQVCLGDRCLGPADFEVVSDAELRLVTPPIPDGPEAVTVFVTVTGPTGTSPERDHARFRYLPRPRVTGLAPARGIATGGTPVAVLGRGFTTASDVDFGAWAATAFAVSSDERIDAVAPAGAGRAHVRVTTACEEPPPLETTLATSCGVSPESGDDLYTWLSLVVLEPAAPHALRLDGGASVVAGGAAWVDSTSPEALRAVGHASLSADPELGLVGGASLAGQAQLQPAPLLGVEPQADPLAFAGPLDTSSLELLDGGLRLLHGRVELPAGVHDGAVLIGGGAEVTLAPGVHVVRGVLALQGAARVDGRGDVLVVLEPGPGGCGLDVQGSAVLLLGASLGPALPGVSVEVSPACAGAGLVSVAGAAALVADGAIHAPGATFLAVGGQPVRAGALVVGRLDVRGGVSLVLQALPEEGAPGTGAAGR